jgi:chromosome segregation protein
MNEDNNKLDLLENQLSKLKLELDKRDQEIYTYLEKIHDSEEEITKLYDMISEKSSEGSSQELIESKFKFELREKEREIRDLKNRMGFLRQEKTIAQRELEEFKKSINSSALSIEEIRKEEKHNQDLLNLEKKIMELRRKLAIQENLLEKQKDDIEAKDRRINDLNLVLKELNQGLKTQNAILEGKVFK